MKKSFKQIEREINECRSDDRFFLLKKLRWIKKQNSINEIKYKKELVDLIKEIEASCQKVRQLSGIVPEITYPELPVSLMKNEIRQAVEHNQVTIICGETGSGKTTQLPKICLEIGRGVRGLIGHTQPRRLAAISVAERISEELGQEVGHSVGYKIRFHAREKEETLVKLMTDGILLAEIMSDRFLSKYDTLIIDEAHERSLNIDFLLGYLKWLLPRRPDLKLLITSATIDPERFSRHFDDAPIIMVSGRTYPVEIRYSPVEGEQGDETDRDLQQAIVDAASELHREQSGDILVFLSGEREIRETAESLRKHHPVDCEILPLYSRLSAKEQQNVFRPHGKRRIVLSTNVAETSLTVPGIRCVIDTGFARISRYSHRSKLQRLPIEKISQASANQRSGRCGRVAKGICIRLYSEDDYEQRAEFTEPEILRTNLASVILQMKSLKLGDIGRFPFVEPPTEKMIRGGMQTLFELGALDEQRNITAIGRKLANFPVDPQLGRMILAADSLGALSEVLIIVSALSIQDPRERPIEYAQAADEKQSGFNDPRSDFIGFLNLWNCFQAQKKKLSNNKLRKFCQEHFLSYLRMREWIDIEQQLAKVVKGDLGMKVNDAPADYDVIHQALLTGLITHAGYKNDQAEYLGVRNSKFFIHPGSALFKAKPKWVMASEQVETTRVYGRNVAAIQPLWIEQAAPHLINHQHYEPHWEKRAGQAMVYERLLLFGLVIHKGRKIPFHRVDKKAAREIFIRSALVERDFECNEPFFKYNKMLLDQAEYEQQKGRRVDLVVDDEQLFRFYDERIPESVCSTATLSKWLKKVADQYGLKLTESDIAGNETKNVDATQFPELLEGENFSLKLEYRFEPGHKDDGVTLLIPLAQLNQLKDELFEWLVPGLLREKIIALIKTLPKSLRRNFVPVPNYADRCLEKMQPGEGSLLNGLPKLLFTFSGIKILASDFQLTNLPPHLLMNFRLLGKNNREVASGRNLKQLQQKFGKQAGDTFSHATKSVGELTGLKEWSFGQLPTVQNIVHGQQKFTGYPALDDEGETAGVRFFDSEKDARVSHIRGVIRLIAIRLKKEFRQLIKNIGVSAADELLYSKFSPHPIMKQLSGNGYRNDFQFCLISSLFRPESIRSSEAFEAALEENKSVFNSRGYELANLMKEIFSEYRNLQKRLEAWKNIKPVAEDIDGQLSRLLYSGFLCFVPYGQLQNFPRYLKALSLRLEKAQGNLNRDVANIEQVSRVEKNFWQSQQTEEGENPELDNFRWMLEEFRVSLFSQPIKTAYPVSSKRLEKAWQARME